MRLRRLEFVILGVTLAFACFMGGFFTGRSWSAVNIVAIPHQRVEPVHIVAATATPAAPAPDNPVTGSTASPSESPTPAVSGNTAPAPETVGAPRGGDGRININLASQSELTDLPGIGNVLASRIVDYRRQHGDFVRIEDIRNVSGIGEKRYEAIQDKITVG